MLCLIEKIYSYTIDMNKKAINLVTYTQNTYWRNVVAQYRVVVRYSLTSYYEGPHIFVITQSI